MYGAYCRGRDRTPDSVRDWRDVPPVPATAFKRLDLYSGLPGAGAGTPPEVVFETSGTTRGSRARGRHPVASLALYRQASLPWFTANLLPGLAEGTGSAGAGSAPPMPSPGPARPDGPDPGSPSSRPRILALVPSPEAAPTSSLSRMMGFVVDFWGDDGSEFLADPVTGVDHGRTRSALEAAAAEGRPVLLMGTAFAWVHWLDGIQAEGRRYAVPEGSRLMETGGFKGRSRAVPRDELYGALTEALDLPVERIVNEYGMTELLSQMYEPHLRTDARPAAATTPSPRSGAPSSRPDSTDPTSAPRHHLAPPWLGVQVLDPETLDRRPPGEPGLLAFFDLANVGSVSAILTEDVGRLDVEGALRLEGRVPGAEPRGCSLAMEALLEAER